jgi:hypothetical protein
MRTNTFRGACDFCLSNRPSGDALKGYLWVVDPRQVTFFAPAKKVTKESRTRSLAAPKSGAVPSAPRKAGREPNSLRANPRSSDTGSLNCPRPRCGARRAPTVFQKLQNIRRNTLRFFRPACVDAKDAVLAQNLLTKNEIVGQTQTMASDDVPVAMQALLNEVQPQLAFDQGDLTMFVMDMPDVPPQYAPIVVAQASQSADPTKTDRTRCLQADRK